jgi:hypothetical protein
MTKHDNYIYGVLEEGSTFKSTRDSSPLLLAAICAVASLHVVSPEVPHESCYEEFVRLCASHAFSSQNNLDDIRGLCIGAFWLADISWSLVSTGQSITLLLGLTEDANCQQLFEFPLSCSSIEHTEGPLVAIGRHTSLLDYTILFMFATINFQSHME